MKYKIIGFISCALAFIVAVTAMFISTELEGDSYKQHKDAPEKEICTVNHINGELCSHLPIISIETNGQEIPGYGIKDEEGNQLGFATAEGGETETVAHISVMDNEKEYNHTTDIPVVSSDVTIHVRGNSSRYFDKYSYAIKLIDDSGDSNPQSLLGMDSHHEWVLHGPYIDKTLIRNYMWYNIAGEIMDYAPNARFCEVMLNGEYNGVYVLTESITAGDDGSRLSLTADAKNNTFSGYLLRLDNGSDTPIKNINTFSSYSLRTNQKINIEFPGRTNLNEEIAEGIRQDFSYFEKIIYSYDFDNADVGYKKLIDVDSFVDYFLINEFTCNYDAGWLSTYIYKDIDGLYRMCIWDFNSACDNYTDSMSSPEHLEMQNCLWYVMLMKDEDFTDRILERYSYLRKTYLSDEYLNDYIDGCIEYLGPAIERNFEKWGYTFSEEYDALYPTERNARNYEQAVHSMKEFIKKRSKWMDENINTVKQYSNSSKVKKFNENAN